MIANEQRVRVGKDAPKGTKTATQGDDPSKANAETSRQNSGVGVD